MLLNVNAEDSMLVYDTNISVKNDADQMRKATNASSSNQVPPFVALHVWKKV
jgi:hypothetical protein